MLQFTHKQISKGIYQITCPGNLPGPGRLPGWGKVNTYLIEGKSRALLIDTGYGNADIKSYVESLTDRPLQVMNTHYHGDHSGGNRQFEEIWIGTNEVSSDLPPDEEQYILEPCAYVANSGPYRFRFLKDGDKISLGERELVVVEIPGHTKGSIAILDQTSKLLFSGDAILKRVLFVSGLPLAAYYRALKRVNTMDFVDIYSAHWPEPLGRDFIGKMMALLRDFDHERSESAPWNVPMFDALNMFAHGAQFEDDDFCAISYVPQQLEILQSEPIE